MEKKEVGRCKDGTYQFGLRKTFVVGVEEVWQLLFSEEGWKILSGGIVSKIPMEKGFEFRTGNLRIQLTTIQTLSHVRMQWQLADWENHSIVQIRTISNKGKTTIAFHQEKLPSAAVRIQMQKHWNQVITLLSNRI